MSLHRTNAGTASHRLPTIDVRSRLRGIASLALVLVLVLLITNGGVG